MKPEKYVITMSLVLLSMLFMNIKYQNRADKSELKTIYTGVSARELYVELPEVDYIPEPVLLDELGAIQDQYTPVVITYEEMELTYQGTYFITAYCPAECGGSWSTASGETCHRADWEDRYSEPTTCAISRSIHSFGEVFYIEEFDRTFVAEDTGPGVQGKHLDLFYEDYSDVLSFPTGYYTVYTVEWVEVEFVTGYYEEG
jgi:3D (Asp-Asp-Asp) domain-containing protein